MMMMMMIYMYYVEVYICLFAMFLLFPTISLGPHVSNEKWALSQEDQLHLDL